VFNFAAAVSLLMCIPSFILGVRSFQVAEMWNSQSSNSWQVKGPDGSSELWNSQWGLYLSRGNLVVRRTVHPAAHSARPGRFATPAWTLGELIPEDSVGPRSLRILRQKQSYRLTRTGHYLTMYGEMGIQLDVWVLVIASGVLPAAACWRFLRARRSLPGTCPVCGYSLL